MSFDSWLERLSSSKVNKYYVSKCHQNAYFKETVMLNILTLILCLWSLGCEGYHMREYALTATIGLTGKSYEI